MKTKSQNRLGRRLYFALLLYLPFQLALNPGAGIDLASSRVIIIGIFLLWLFWSLANKKLQIPFTLQTFALLGFLFFTLLSLINAENLAWGLRKWLVFASILPLYFPACWYLRKEKSLEKSAIFLFAASSLTSIAGILQFSAQFFVEKKDFFTFWSQKVAPYFLGSSVAETVAENPSWFVEIGGEAILRAIAFFPDPHILSFFIGISLPLTLILLDTPNLKYKILITTGVSFQITALFLTFSRGGYLGLITSIIVISLLVLSQASLQLRKRVFVGIVVVIAVLFIINPIRARLLSTFDLADQAVAGRITIWKEATNTFRLRPLLGVGLGNYAYYINPAASYRFPIYAHNTYLDLAAETGIVGLSFWLLLLGAGGASCLKVFFSSAQKNKKITSLALGGAITYFAVHTLFETPIFSPRILPLFAVIIAATSMLNKQ